MGNITSLKPEIGEKHPFSAFDTGMSPSAWANKYGNMTTFYGRDRGDEDQEFVTHTSKESLIESFNDGWCEFAYIMKDNTWYVCFKVMRIFICCQQNYLKKKIQ
jgi:hypothetical protein